MITYFRAISMDGERILSPDCYYKEEVLAYMIEEYARGTLFCIIQIYELE